VGIALMFAGFNLTGGRERPPAAAAPQQPPPRHAVATP
jgi:hypothetical protein